MTWSLYREDKFLKPLCFSNGKTQENVVEEVLRKIEEGKRIIFIKGVCGTGKSAIALNIAKELGKASIVVPIKNLQRQYKDDYETKKYLIKENKEKLKIKVLTGRKNHECKFLKDNELILKKKPTLNIYDGNYKEDFSADNKEIPCKIEIKSKNWQQIREYLKLNKDINHTEIQEIKDVKRASIAPVCPYWSPVLPSKYEFKQDSIANAKQKKYTGISGQEYTYYCRKSGCSYYEQFASYIDADVLVFNSLKYKLESILGRKPETEVDIIDECDEFLDSFSNKETINIGKLQSALVWSFGLSENFENIQNELAELIAHLKKDRRLIDSAKNGEITPLKNTGLYDILKILLRNPEFFEEVEDENYLYDVLEIAKMFEKFFNETYITTEIQDDNLKINLVTTNLSKMFEAVLGKNKVLVLMSGTLHSKEILEKVFGMKNFEIIDAETENQGSIRIKKTGMEKDFRYSNFGTKYSRINYLEALDKCLEVAKKPILVHINAFRDLPSNDEKKILKLSHTLSQEEVIKIQKSEGEKNLVKDFKNKEIDVLFTTRASRGVDFPGDQCRSIVFTKYPNPNVQDAFWKILNKTHAQYYWSFYKDKAVRELWQRVYRGIRFPGDSVDVLSPDIRVLEGFEK